MVRESTSTNKFILMKWALANRESSFMLLNMPVKLTRLLTLNKLDIQARTVLMQKSPRTYKTDRPYWPTDLLALFLLLRWAFVTNLNQFLAWKDCPETRFQNSVQSSCICDVVFKISLPEKLVHVFEVLKYVWYFCFFLLLLLSVTF